MVSLSLGWSLPSFYYIKVRRGFTTPRFCVFRILGMTSSFYLDYKSQRTMLVPLRLLQQLFLWIFLGFTAVVLANLLE